MSTRLVIVESPAKAKKIAEFLGDGYIVESSVGHIRDLPANAAEVPKAHKGKPWASMGVDVDNDFEPVYVVSARGKETVRNLKALLKQADELLLATDEDREGEAIAWHLLEVLKPKVPVKRMVFHEITKQAILEAVDNSRDLDERLVDAQEARRILDRLYGYEVSPVLWKKIKPKLSAGRVQSVATRVIVEREQERMAFVSAEYWDLSAEINPPAADGDEAAAVATPFPATMQSLDGSRLASGRDFGQDGRLQDNAKLVLDEARATALADGLGDSAFEVQSVETKPYRRKPPAPFATSTLQQEAARKLRFSAQRTMQVAQRLYENGFITYMRTDSTTLSQTALDAARSQILAKYGADYVPDKPRIYAKKVKNAQEAHEAIRPAGETFRTPEQLKRELGKEELRLYELIWMRTIASQMEDARGQTVRVLLDAVVASGADEGKTAQFSASGRTITFPGFLRAYVEGSDDPDAQLEDREIFLPEMAEGDRLQPQSVSADGHETKPPARFTEASLVKQLEDLGVGRPSTYASIIGTIINRGYVLKKGSALVPTLVAFAKVGLLKQHFTHLVDYAFTASMEDDLDEIANGEKERGPWLSRFYFGGDDPDAVAAAAGGDGDGSSGAGQDEGAPAGLHDMVTNRLDEIDAAAINSFPLGEDSDGHTIVARVGRYGPYLQRGDDTASIPEEMAPDELTIAMATELLDKPNDDRLLGNHPDGGKPIIARNGRFGPYVQLGDTADGKPEKTASLLSTQSLDTITLDDALKLLTLPRDVGPHPEDKGEILVQNGRYGPYLKWGKETRSLATEEEMFTIDLDGALKLLAEEKKGRKQRENPVIRELGEDSVSGEKMSIRTGRFGPYVTDGEVNASLRKGDTVEDLSDERASELLQMRRERMAAGGKKTTKKKKAAKKKSTKKKSTRKKAVKKATKKAAKKAT